MEIEEKLGIGLIIILLISAIIISTHAQAEYTGRIMNASISQPICIVLSDKLTEGIFFTNTTTIGIQYPITNMTTENNATQNYNGPGYGTLYNVTACGGNTINISTWLNACEHLKNGTNTIYLTYDAGDNGQGAFFGNGTTATTPTLTVSSAWALYVDNYRLIGNNTAPGNTTFLRFWLDPYPNNAPSGIYNTTFKIKAQEFVAADPGYDPC
jgi:hypothetical protein